MLSQTADMEKERPLKAVKGEPAIDDKQNLDLIRSIDQLLSMMFFMPGTRRFIADLSEDVLKNPAQKAVFAFLEENPTIEPGLVTSKITDYKELSEYENYVKILAVNFEELFQDIETLELQYEAERLKNKIIEQYVRSKKLTISLELKDADQAEERVLLEESGRLDKMLKSKKV